MGSSSTSNTATDTGRILSGRSARLTESGSFQLGDKARYAETGSIGDNSTLKLGSDFSGASLMGSSVTIGETGVAKTFADTIRDLFAGQSQQNDTLLSALLPRGATTTTTATSDPDTADPGDDGGKKKILLAVAALAVLGAVFWFFNRK